MEAIDENKQKAYWGQVVDFARSAICEDEFNAEELIENGLEDFILTPRPGVKWLLAGDVLYSGNKSITIVKVGAFAIADNGLQIDNYFRDGDAIDNSFEKWYLTPQVPTEQPKSMLIKDVIAKLEECVYFATAWEAHQNVEKLIDELKKGNRMISI